MTKRSEPVRTCVGCRQRAAKSDLVRVIAAIVEQPTGDQFRVMLCPDPRGSLPGRGAHLHLDEQCLALALRRKAFVRALRLTSLPDPTAVTAYVARQTVPDA